RLQRPLLPLLGDGEDLVCDPAYGAVRYGNPIDVLDMSLNIAGGHALGVHGQDLFLNVLADAGLTLFQHLRLKLPFPVPGNRDLHVSKACPERLAAMTIPAVVCSLVLVVISAVAQILIQLCLQTVLHEFGNGLLEQVLDVIHAADVCHLQKFSDLLSTGVFFLGAVLSGHMLILLYDASILHLSGSLHKLWDSLEFLMSYFVSDVKKIYKNRLVQITLLLFIIVAVSDPLFVRFVYGGQPGFSEQVGANPFQFWLLMYSSGWGHRSEEHTSELQS